MHGSWWPCGSTFQVGGVLRSSFGGISTDKFGGHSVCVCSVVVSVQQQTQEPPQEVLVVVMSCQVWWSFGSVNSGSVVSRMGGMRLRLRCEC